MPDTYGFPSQSTACRTRDHRPTWSVDVRHANYFRLQRGQEDTVRLLPGALRSLRARLAHQGGLRRHPAQHPDKCMIVIVTGSREWGEPAHRRLGRGTASVWVPLDRIRMRRATPENPLVVRNGMASRGLDLLVHEWCEAYKDEHVIEDPHPADWTSGDKRAGLRRNGDMVRKGADMGLAWAVPCSKGAPWCPPGLHPTHGTADCVDKMRRAGIPVFFCPKGMKW